MATTTRPERSLVARVFWTLSLPLLLVWVSGRILLPGLSEGLLSTLDRAAPYYRPTGSPHLGIFALGIGPMLVGYGLVELVAMAVPPLRRFRHENPKGRASLERAARILGLVLAAFQGFGVAQSLRSLEANALSMSRDIGTISVPIVVATLIGGVCVTLIVADIVTRQGIANGIVLFLAIDAVSMSYSSIRSHFSEALSSSGHSNRRERSFSPSRSRS